MEKESTEFTDRVNNSNNDKALSEDLEYSEEEEPDLEEKEQEEQENIDYNCWKENSSGKRPSFSSIVDTDYFHTLWNEVPWVKRAFYIVIVWMILVALCALYAAYAVYCQEHRVSVPPRLVNAVSKLLRLR